MVLHRASHSRSFILRKILLLLVRAGSLLVASRRLDGTLFGGSVVLITEHSAAGARGVILNRPYEGGAAGALGGAVGRREAAREHFGGPVSGARVTLRQGQRWD